VSKRQSREQWEQEVRDVQGVIQPHEEVRLAEIFARRMPPGAALFKSARQVRDVLLGIVLLGFGVVLGVYAVTLRTSLPGLSVAGLILGLLLAVFSIAIIAVSFTDRRPKS
jgi:hypothetical protein